MPVDFSRDLLECREVKLLLLCARTPVDDTRIGAIRELVREELDWNYLCYLATVHGIVGLLYRALNNSGAEKVPQWVMEALRVRSLAVLGRSRLMAGELLRLLALMEKQGVVAIPFKGPILADTLYGDLCTREFSDLDLAVPRRDVHAATSIILQEGYRSRYPLEKGMEEVLMRIDKEFVFARDDLGVLLDLHWCFAESRFSFKFDVEIILERCVTVTVGERSVLAFSPEDVLLLLGNHGSLHAWERLKWICDVAQLVRCHGRLDYEWILSTAEGLRSSRRTLLGLFLAQDLLGTDLPEPVLAGIQADPMILRLAQGIKVRLFQYPRQELSPLDLRIFQNHLIEGLASKAKYFFGVTCSINTADLECVKLPKFLGFLYYAVRPTRLMASYGIKLIQKAIFLKRNALH
jgi:hypothetical protein